MGSRIAEISITLSHCLGAEHQWTSDPQAKLLGRMKEKQHREGKITVYQFTEFYKKESLKIPCIQRFVSAIINFHNPKDQISLFFITLSE